MNHTLTTTLSEWVFKFLREEAKRKKVTQKSIIEKWLEYYKKFDLEKQVKDWFKNRELEYKNISNDFKDLQFNSIKD